MTRRSELITGNWKMNLLRAPACELVAGVVRALDRTWPAGVRVALAPPYTAIDLVRDAIRGSGVMLAAQDVAGAAEGAYTGEVSAAMLADAGVGLVIVGHSERRHILGETDAVVLEKVRRAFEVGLQVTLCVGETGKERNAGCAKEVVERQIRAVVSQVDLRRVTLQVAYEPIWAIGTGCTPTPEDVRSMHVYIRATVAVAAGRDVAEDMIIQYGGSVKPGNAAELLAQDGVDGLLVGSASLEAASFAAIVFR